MSCLSTACFVYKKASKHKSSKFEISSGRKKTNVKIEEDATKDRAKRMSIFTRLWDNVLQAVETARLDMYSEILDDCVRHIANAATQNINCGNCVEIPTLNLVTGVNVPDHRVIFSVLKEKLQRSVSPYVVSLVSTDDADSVKTAIQKVFSTLAHKDDIPSNKTRHTMPNLIAWYKAKNSDARCLSSKSFSSSPSKRRKTAKNMYPIIIVFEDFERLLPSFVRDFILLCSEHAARLPLIFVFGISTSTDVVNQILSQSCMSKLVMESFTLRKSNEHLDIILNAVLLRAKFPFKLSEQLFTFFEDVFLYNDLSVKSFISGLKFCLMDYYYRDSLSILCCHSSEIEERVDELNDAALDELRKLPSFRTFVEGLPVKKQKELLISNGYLKEVTKSKLNELDEYHRCFFPMLHLLHAFVKDLPKNLSLGRQLRELYGKCLETDIADSKEFLTFLKILRTMDKVDLLERVKSGISTLATLPCHAVLHTIKVDLENILEKLEYCKYGPRTTPTKDVSGKGKGQPTFQVLRETLVNAIETSVRNYLKCQRSFVFYEIFYIGISKATKSQLIGSHRCSLDRALVAPTFYLQCADCKSTENVYQNLPDVCIAYKLQAEYNRLINLHDWLESFDAVVRPSSPSKKGAIQHSVIDKQLVARFFHVVAELQFLGLIKPSQGKTDHFTRTAW